MSEMIELHGVINGADPSRRLRIAREGRHALDVLVVLTNSLPSPELRIRTDEAIQAVREALEQ